MRRIRRYQWTPVLDAKGETIPDPNYGTPKKAFRGVVYDVVKATDRKQAHAKRQFKRISHRNNRRVSKQALEHGAAPRPGKLSYRRPKTRLEPERGDD